MQTGFRFRCYPTPQQAQILRRWIGCQRFIYNAKVSEDRYFRAFARKALALTGQQPPQDQCYSQFITPDTAWLRDVPSQVLRNGAVRWKQAYSRYYRQLARRPRLHPRHGPQSVWLTRELFSFTPVSSSDSEQPGYRLTLGTRKCPVGELAYTAHRPHAAPATLVLTLDAGRWYLSFSQDDGQALPAPQDIADWLAGFPETELRERTLGLDRGVAVPLMSSSGQAFTLDEGQRQRIARQQAAARRWQRRQARRAKGGANRRKAVQRIAVLRRYEKDVRQDFAHQTSHRLVSEPDTLLLVFEALGVQRMTRKPKARQDERGRWLRNGARAKAGLNGAILSSGWGRLREYCTYKALRVGKLVIEVPAHHTSQACSVCGHTHPDNRPSQAEFVCQRCGHTANADHNASENIRQRGVALIRSGEYRERARKTVMRLRTTEPLGAGSSEVTPGETTVSRGGGNVAVLGSLSQETPTSTRAAS